MNLKLVSIFTSLEFLSQYNFERRLVMCKLNWKTVLWNTVKLHLIKNFKISNVLFQAS